MRRPLVLLAAVLVPLCAGSAAAIVVAGVADPHNLPIGKRVSTTAAARGSVFACSLMSGGGGASATGSWIHTNGTYDITVKPKVEGNVAWPNAVITFTAAAGRVTVSGNGLPKVSRTGIYPVSPSSEAYRYDRNPNTITAQTVSWQLPRAAVAPKASCLTGGPIGVALNGVAIFNALDAENRDAVAYEILDRCQGHPERSGRYHYHSIPACLTAGQKANRHSTAVGFAFDGFPISGPRGDGGKVLSNAKLDACHGHTGWVVVRGKRVRTYHYHATIEYPYTLGCFRGTPLRLQSDLAPGGPGGGVGGPPSTSPPPSN